MPGTPTGRDSAVEAAEQSLGGIGARLGIYLDNGKYNGNRYLGFSVRVLGLRVIRTYSDLGFRVIQ